MFPSEYFPFRFSWGAVDCTCFELTLGTTLDDTKVGAFTDDEGAVAIILPLKRKATGISGSCDATALTTVGDGVPTPVVLITPAPLLPSGLASLSAWLRGLTTAVLVCDAEEGIVGEETGVFDSTEEDITPSRAVDETMGALTFESKGVVEGNVGLSLVVAVVSVVVTVACVIIVDMTGLGLLKTEDLTDVVDVVGFERVGVIIGDIEDCG